MGSESDERKDVLRELLDFEKIVLRDCEKERETGEGLMVQCPFHDDDTPSLSVNLEKKVFFCHGCKVQGDLFDWVQRIEGVDFPEALDLLEDRYNIDVGGEGEHSRSESSVNRGKGNHEKDLQQAVKEAAEYYYRSLREETEGEDARQYLLEERGFSWEVLDHFKVGYSPRREGSLLNSGVQDEMKDRLAKAGILKDTGEFYSERFGGRVVFPIRSRTGGYLGMAGRRLPGESGPKYINTPETTLYRKREVLYGIGEARDQIRKRDQALLVEGYTDVLRLWQEGVQNAVASCGTSFTRKQADLVSRFGKEVVFVFDGDEAGLEAGMDGIKVAIPNPIIPQAVRLPDGEDPAELAERVGEQAQEVIEEEKKGFLEFITREADRKGALQRPETRVKIHSKVAGAIAEIPQKGLRREYVKDAARWLKVPPEDMYTKVQEVRGEKVQKREKRRYKEMRLGMGPVDEEETTAHQKKSGARRKSSRENGAKGL